MTRKKWLPIGALSLLFLLHQDTWNWNDPTLILGLPVGLTYHIGFCLLTAAVMLVLVRFAWPFDGPDGESSP